MATATERANFIAKVAPLIQAEAKKRGYKVCSPIIAQACCEGNFGQSTLAKPPYNNHFGMKCGSSWKGASVNLKTKEEYTAGTLTTIRDNFRAYPSLEEGIKGYFDFVSTKRYANLKTASTPEEYCQNLKADGYATSSKYVSTLLSYINNYNLRKYDNADYPVCPYKRYSTIMKKGSRGESVKWLQWWLNRYGYGLVVDGKFGIATEYAVGNFQMKHNLKVDNIVGKYTIYALENSL